jgi:hypothetical protein
MDRRIAPSARPKARDLSDGHPALDDAAPRVAGPALTSNPVADVNVLACQRPNSFQFALEYAPTIVERATKAKGLREMIAQPFVVLPFEERRITLR